MPTSRPPIGLVSLALIGFAANSLFCRLALRPPSSIDPLSFTLVRIASGAIVLTLLSLSTGKGRPGGNWGSAVALFAYAIAFSVAYVRITAGIGALILFASVQLTMFVAGIRAGERLRPVQWVGVVLAIAGLVILSWRGITAPDPLSALFMATAGVAWGIYSLRGRITSRPLADTAGNFARAVPFAIVCIIVAMSTAHLSRAGLLYAIASGALASGVGYSIWYAALPRLTATNAAIVQLSVPVIAAAGGIAFLGEKPTLRLLLATITILSGVALAVLARRRLPA